MKLGITGTRYGMTLNQSAVLEGLLDKPSEFHHGSCQGADVEAARIVRLSCGVRIICHPGPDGDPHRQDSGVDDVVLPGKNHFARNRDIVDACDALVACPDEKWDTLPKRGGTAYTLGYALKHGKPVVVIWPDGSISDGKELAR